jgi:hypothetical protein
MRTKADSADYYRFGFAPWLIALGGAPFGFATIKCVKTQASRVQCMNDKRRKQR